MEFVPAGLAIDFVGKRRYAYVLSSVVIVATLVWIVVGGPRYGVDFAGGTLVHVRLAPATTVGAVRTALATAGLAEGEVQSVGGGEAGEFLVRLPRADTRVSGASASLLDRVKGSFGEEEVQVLRVETVGPKVGAELRRKGIWAGVLAVVGILAYLSLRFEFPYALGAVAATFHDGVVGIGAIVLTGREFDLTILAALLTIVGYSVNDTIVVFDRVRENLTIHRRRPLPELMNLSINETLSRTLLTSLTTLLVVLALFVFGGGVIHDFAFLLLVGVITGTYSTIYIAGSIVLAWQARFGRRRPRR